MLQLEQFTPRAPSRCKVRIAVTHVSVGSTDGMARAGDYLLQPRPGFVPGYDFVGVLETVDDAAARRGLQPAMRVAGCLPRMGSYTTQLDVPADRVVPLPDGLDSARAAALPLDLVTAALAIDFAKPVVRTAWSARPGHGRLDAALGGFVANLRRYAKPRERLCSVPLLVALQPAKYRQMLTDQLNRIVDGSLAAPTVTTVPFAEVVDAHRRLATVAPGQKLVLEMDRP